MGHEGEKHIKVSRREKGACCVQQKGSRRKINVNRTITQKRRKVGRGSTTTSMGQSLYGKKYRKGKKIY